MDKVRLITEVIQLIGALLYIAAALREMRFLGYHMFIENLVRTNAKKLNQIQKPTFKY